MNTRSIDDRSLLEGRGPTELHTTGLHAIDDFVSSFQGRVQAAHDTELMRVEDYQIWGCHNKNSARLRSAPRRLGARAGIG